MPPAISDQNQFLSDLSATELAALRPHLVDFDISVGDCLHHIGDPIERVVFPHSGVICLTVPVRDKAEAVVALVGREGIVGGLLATASVPSSCNAEVRIVGRASVISAAAFRRALDHHPGIRRLAARYDAAMLAQVLRNAVCNAAHKVEGRISRCMLELHDRSGDDKIPLKQETLAQLLAIRRTTVTLDTACKTEQAAQFCLDDENKERDDATAVPSLCRPLALFAPTLCQLQACSNASAIGVLVAMAEGASLRIEKRVTLVLISRLD
jgi:CRP-like cAMP-binding protein